MSVVSHALPAQLSDNIRAVLDVGNHEESAHVSLGYTNRRMFHDLVDALQIARPRCPLVLVEKMPALLKLVHVQQRAAKLDVFHGLGRLHLMLLEPSWFVLVYGFVELLQ